MEETLFYAFGFALVLAAVAVAFLGLRAPEFPGSRGALAGLIAGFTALVVGTGVFGVLLAEEEQAHREEEAAEVNLAEEPAEQPTGEEPTTEEPPATGGGGDVAAEGEAIFTSQGCASCHSLQAAGASGTTGPNLDESLAGQDVAYIEEGIVDPDAQIAEGYSGGIMPQTYEQDLTPEQLEILVQYLAESTGAQQ